MENRDNTLIIIIAIIVVSIIAVAIGAFFIIKNFNSNDNNVINDTIEQQDYTSEENENTSNTSTNNDNSIDYEIAKILFASFFEDEFDEKLISEYSYDTKNKEFSCMYVIKTYDELDKDYVEIRTNDFITYTYTRVEYKYDEESKMNVPYTWNSTYTELSNEDKNKIIDLANSKNYYTSENVSNDEYEKILEIIFENDNNNLKETLRKNNFILKDKYISDNQINYEYVQKDNESNYLSIYSWVSGVMGWNVYGSSDKKIFEDSEYSNDSYIIDYDIEIEKNLNEIEKISDKLGLN